MRHRTVELGKMNDRRIRNRFVLIVVGFSLTLLLSFFFTSVSAQNFTGCLKNNGKIVKVAPGDDPTKPCKSNQTEIVLSNPAGYQVIDSNPEALLIPIGEFATVSAECPLGKIVTGGGCGCADITITQSGPVTSDNRLDPTQWTCRCSNLSSEQDIFLLRAFAICVFGEPPPVE